MVIWLDKMMFSIDKEYLVAVFTKTVFLSDSFHFGRSIAKFVYFCALILNQLTE
jgi:hypothetical protein